MDQNLWSAYVAAMVRVTKGLYFMSNESSCAGCSWHVVLIISTAFRGDLCVGMSAAETVARGTARALSEVTGVGNDAVDVEVEPMLARLIGTGPVRPMKLYTTETGGGGAAGSGAAASKPALA